MKDAGLAFQDKRLFYGFYTWFSVLLNTEMRKLRDNSNEPESKFQALVAALPSDASEFPTAFSDDDLTHLEGSMIVPKINDFKKGLVDDYNLLCSLAPDTKSLMSFEEYRFG